MFVIIVKKYMEKLTLPPMVGNRCMPIKNNGNNSFYFLLACRRWFTVAGIIIFLHRL